MAEQATPEQDKQLEELQQSLEDWVKAANAKGIDLGVVLTALMLFTASAAAPADIEREEFLDALGKYLDMYRGLMKRQS